VGPRAGLDGCGKSRPLPPTGIRSLDRPARSESLYQQGVCPFVVIVFCYREFWGCGPCVDIHGSRFVLAINTRPCQVIREYFGVCIRTGGGWGTGGRVPGE